MVRPQGKRVSILGRSDGIHQVERAALVILNFLQPPRLPLPPAVREQIPVKFVLNSRLGLGLGLFCPTRLSALRGAGAPARDALRDSALGRRRSRRLRCGCLNRLNRLSCTRRLLRHVLFHQPLRTENHHRYKQKHQQKAPLGAGFLLWALVFRHSTSCFPCPCGNRRPQLSSGAKLRNHTGYSPFDYWKPPAAPDQIRRAQMDGNAARATSPSLIPEKLRSVPRLQPHTQNRSARTGTREAEQARAPICIREAAPPAQPGAP